MKTRLEFKDKKSHKFWEITLRGKSHTVRFGRVGTPGQTKTKEFDSPAEARKSCEKLIALKLKKGYREVVKSSSSKKAGKIAAKTTTSENGVAASWSRITTWLREHAPELAKTLKKGASQADIAWIEEKLGTPLPEDVAALYRLCGGAPESDLFPAREPCVGYSLIPLKQLPRVWKGQKEWDGFKPTWLPIATNGGGDYQCIDLAAKGRLIQWDHEIGKAERVATSLGARLKNLAQGLEKGKYVYDEDEGIVRCEEEPPRPRGKPDRENATKKGDPRTGKEKTESRATQVRKSKKYRLVYSNTKTGVDYYVWESKRISFDLATCSFSDSRIAGGPFMVAALKGDRILGPGGGAIPHSDWAKLSRGVREAFDSPGAKKTSRVARKKAGKKSATRTGAKKRR